MGAGVGSAPRAHRPVGFGRCSNRAIEGEGAHRAQDGERAVLRCCYAPLPQAHRGTLRAPPPSPPTEPKRRAGFKFYRSR